MTGSTNYFPPGKEKEEDLYNIIHPLVEDMMCKDPDKRPTLVEVRSRLLDLRIAVARGQSTTRAEVMDDNSDSVRSFFCR